MYQSAVGRSTASKYDD